MDPAAVRDRQPPCLNLPRLTHVLRGIFCIGYTKISVNYQRED